MNRRNFIKTAALAPLFGAVGASASTPTAASSGQAWSGKNHPLAGKKLPPWKPGEFQVHFIYTGVGESLFLIFPDGTTMLLDCGDFDAAARGDKAVPILPNPSRHAGEWIARYVTRVNPAITDVDYMLLSHYHSDHGGSDDFVPTFMSQENYEICSGEKDILIIDGAAHAESYPTDSAAYEEKVKEFISKYLDKESD